MPKHFKQLAYKDHMNSLWYMYTARHTRLVIRSSAKIVAEWLVAATCTTPCESDEVQNCLAIGPQK